MNLGIVECLGDGLREKLPQPHLDILSSGTILQQQWTVWKSTWKIFGDTKSEGICFTIIGGSFWRWLHPGSLVEYPTVPGGMEQINRVQKDPYWNDEKKTLRIYFAQSNGWLFWRVIRIVKLLKLKLHSDRSIFLRVCLDAHHPAETRWEQQELIRVRSLLKIGCLWLWINHITAVVSWVSLYWPSR